MRLLLVHSDFLEYEVKQSTPAAEKVAHEKKAGRFDEVLVAFTAVEEDDEKDMAAAAKISAKEIADVAKQVKAQRVAVYPYAHLSPSLASPKSAVKILDGVRDELEKLGLEAHRLPFGWYKAFKVSCKGHPLSELSRQINVGKQAEELSEALKQEEKVKSTWHVLEPDGKIIEIFLKDNKISGYNFSKNENLKLFAIHEMAKQREAREEPPHVQLMRRLDLLDYEPGSDSGNFRFYPKGRLVKGLLEDWVSRRVKEYGAMEIETPIMYDYEHPALKDYLERFPARQYTLKSTKKKLFLRFSACFGQFLMAASSTISYRDLPLKMYELTRYSFRLEKAGELSGLRRLRSFTMPDMHTICESDEQAKREFLEQFKLSMRCLNDLGFGLSDYETGIRMTQDFWDKNKDFVVSLAKLVFNFVDNVGKASALSTVQMDHENAKRYGIYYINEKNEKNLPLILHCSPSGSLERVIYALLEKAYGEQKRGKSPSLPIWLAPTQVRLVSIADRHVKFCEDIADELEKSRVRVDIDDRSETVQKKVREAEREWVPMVIVIGDKELDQKKLPVRVRGRKELSPMSVKELCSEISAKTKDLPFKPLPLPRNLSKRPIFVGAD